MTEPQKTAKDELTRLKEAYWRAYKDRHNRNRTNVGDGLAVLAGRIRELDPCWYPPRHRIG